MKFANEVVRKLIPGAATLIVVLFGLQGTQAQCVSTELKQQWSSGQYTQVLGPLADCYKKRPLGVTVLEIEYMLAKTLCNVHLSDNKGCKAYSSLKANHGRDIGVFGFTINLDRDACCQLPDYSAAKPPAQHVGMSQHMIRVPFSDLIREVQDELSKTNDSIRRAETASFVRYSPITSKLSGRCLDIMYGSTENGALLLQFDCHGQGNQAWRFVKRDDGYYNIIVLHSGKCLDVNGASQANGVEIIQHDCHDGDNQRWNLVRSEDGYSIVAKHSGKCLDVYQWNQENMAHIVQWDCHGGANQKWTISAEVVAPGVTVGPPTVRRQAETDRVVAPPPPSRRRPPVSE